MSKTEDILSEPVRVNERADCVYFFDGMVCADIIGPEEQRKATLRLVAQAQRMARLLTDATGCTRYRVPDDCGSCFGCRAKAVLRDAGVSGPDDRGGA
jgi:hypothetical protein